MSAQLGFAGIAPTVEKASIVRDALLSPCSTFRYWLLRIWDASRPIGLVTMINPSKADDHIDDPTVTNLMKRGKHWGWGGYYAVNLAAFRSSHPDDLSTAKDPIGPECDVHIARLADNIVHTGGQLVAAWGASVDFRDPGTRPELRGRDGVVLRLLCGIGDVWCLGRTSNGSPTHPSARGTHRVPVETPLAMYAPRTGGGDARPVAKVVRPFSEVPPHPEDRPAVGHAPRGPCAWCQNPAEGRYGLPWRGGVAPLCDVCGPGFRPTLTEVYTKLREHDTVRV